MIDYLIIAVLTYALSWFLNKKFFNENPLSQGKAILISVGMFIVLTIVLTGLMHFRNTELGIPTKKLFDFSSIGLSIFFYLLLNRKKKGEFEILTADGGSVAKFESKEKADEYISKNSEKNYFIKEN